MSYIYIDDVFLRTNQPVHSTPLASAKHSPKTELIDNENENENEHEKFAHVETTFLAVVNHLCVCHIYNIYIYIFTD